MFQQATLQWRNEGVLELQLGAQAKPMCAVVKVCIGILGPAEFIRQHCQNLYLQNLIYGVQEENGQEVSDDYDDHDHDNAVDDEDEEEDGNSNLNGKCGTDQLKEKRQQEHHGALQGNTLQNVFEFAECI